MTTTETLASILARTNGQQLVMRVGRRPAVVARDGTTRDFGTTDVTATSMDALVSAILPDAQQLLSAGKPTSRDFQVGDSSFRCSAVREGTDVCVQIERVAPAAATKPAAPPARLQDWVAAAAVAGARQLYLRVGAVPSVRLGDGVRRLHQLPLGKAEFEALVHELGDPTGGWVPEGDGFRPREADPLTAECLPFRDSRGAGITIKLRPPALHDAIMRDLPPVARDLCAGSDGLVFAAAPTRRELTTLMEAMVTWIAQRRAVSLISVDREPQQPIDREAGFVSRRCVCDEVEFVDAVTRTIAECPDVLVLDDVATADAIEAAIAAAREGCLVVAGVRARDSIDALQNLTRAAGDVAQQSDVAARIATVWSGSISRRNLPRQSGGHLTVSDAILPLPLIVQHLLQLDFNAVRQAQALRLRGTRSAADGLARAVSRRVLSTAAATRCVDRDELARALHTVRRRRRAARIERAVQVPGAVGASQQQEGVLNR